MRFLPWPVCRVFLGTVIALVFAHGAWGGNIDGPLPYGGEKTVNATNDASASPFETSSWVSPSLIGPKPYPVNVNTEPNTSWDDGGTSSLAIGEDYGTGGTTISPGILQLGSGDGAISLTGSNTYNGGTLLLPGNTINSATLALAGNTINEGAVKIIPGLVFSGSPSLQSLSAGSASVNSSFAGTINLGTPVLNLGNVDYASTASLAGSTSVNNGPVVSNGGTAVLQPNGNGSTGNWQLTGSCLTVGPGATLVFDSTAAAPVISGNGNLAESLDGLGSGGTVVDAGTLVDAANGSIPDGASLTVGPGGIFAFHSPQTVVGSPAVMAAASGEVTAVPEPNTLVLLVVAAGTAYFWRRRSR